MRRAGPSRRWYERLDTRKNREAVLVDRVGMHPAQVRVAALFDDSDAPHLLPLLDRVLQPDHYVGGCQDRGHLWVTPRALKDGNQRRAEVGKLRGQIRQEAAHGALIGQ